MQMGNVVTQVGAISRLLNKAWISLLLNHFNPQTKGGLNGTKVFALSSVTNFHIFMKK
jgi:hypothetical protein